MKVFISLCLIILLSISLLGTLLSLKSQKHDLRSKALEVKNTAVMTTLPNPMIYGYGMRSDYFQKYFVDNHVLDVANAVEISADSKYRDTAEKLQQRGILPVCTVKLWFDSSCMYLENSTGDTSLSFCSHSENEETCIQRIVDRAVKPFTSGGFTAIALDEFNDGGVRVHSIFTIEQQVIQRFRSKLNSLGYSKAIIIAWTTLGSNLAEQNLDPATGQDMTATLRDLKTSANLIINESYIKSWSGAFPIPGTSTDPLRNKILAHANAMNTAAPGILSKSILGLGINDIHQSYNKDPSHSFKDFLSRELSIITTEASTKVMPGIAAYMPVFAHPDTSDFFYQLAKSVFIDKKGLTNPVLLKSSFQNPGFESGLTSWDVKQGRGAIVGIKTYSNLGVNFYSSLSAPEGKNALYFKRGSDLPAQWLYPDGKPISPGSMISSTLVRTYFENNCAGTVADYRCGRGTDGKCKPCSADGSGICIIFPGSLTNQTNWKSADSCTSASCIWTRQTCSLPDRGSLPLGQGGDRTYGQLLWLTPTTYNSVSQKITIESGKKYAIAMFTSLMNSASSQTSIRMSLLDIANKTITIDSLETIPLCAISDSPTCKIGSSAIASWVLSRIIFTAPYTGNATLRINDWSAKPNEENLIDFIQLEVLN